MAMCINKNLVPIKAHFLFFMAAMGPILPQLPVIGKQLGISAAVMGTITGILPFAYLLAKPIFGIIVDVYRDYRKSIFIALISVMALSYSAIYFIPTSTSSILVLKRFNISYLQTCNSSVTENYLRCNSEIEALSCSSDCWDEDKTFLAAGPHDPQYTENNVCILANTTTSNRPTQICNITCNDSVMSNKCLYQSASFWAFIILMSIGTIGYNIIISISDAICFDVIGNKYDYGKQRVWGTFGFGLTALIAGFLVDYFSSKPIFAIIIICAVLDLLACIKLELPIIAAPENIFKDLQIILSSKQVIIFMVFTVFAGVLDSIIIYYLFWYLEDLAELTNTTNVKLIEGLIVAAETLGAEVLFFYLSGKILKYIGSTHCFSLCFLNYSIRLGLISLVPSPWWILPIELLMQGPTYALTYTTIVKCADDLSTPGTSATMQGIASGMGEGTGYALGSIFGGLLYQYIGGKYTIQAFSFFGMVCCILHVCLQKTSVKPQSQERNNYEAIID